MAAQATPSKDGASPSPSRRTLKSSELLGERNELHIEHNGEVYLLRRTSNGKLILTK
jgi:hemin uptake protein HemP